jgi:hypothetical protein
MKTLLMLALMLASTAPRCCAQQLTWELRMGQRILQTGTETGKPDTIYLSRKDSVRLESITLRFRENSSTPAWRYSLVCTDQAQRVLLERPIPTGSDSCVLSQSEWTDLSRRSPYFWLFLEQHPADPQSFIRSRRTSIAVLHIQAGK